MLSNRYMILGCVAAIVVLMSVACSPTSTDQVPTDILAETGEAVTADDMTYVGDPSNLRPCGDVEVIRTIQASAPSAPNPVTTPSPTATPDMRPAPSEDRVGLPENYATEFKLLFIFDRVDRKLVRAICANEIAARRKEGEPFAYGSELLMLSYVAQVDSEGEPLLDDNGNFIGGNLITLHMMQKEQGFGEAYQDTRAGEWEYVAYRADGTYDTRPENSSFCAACHGGESSAAQDYTFRMSMIDPHHDMHGPAAGENEISIYLYTFHDPELTITAGTTVTWINNDEAAHSILAVVRDETGTLVPATDVEFASGIMPSANIEAGASYSFTFDEPGEYLYLCSIHKNMIGKVIVTE